MNIESIINGVNSNKYLYGVLMILLNMGSKYIEMDLVQKHKKFLSSKILRRLVIFTIAFIATRDIVASFIITAAFIIIVLNLFNDESDYSIIGKQLDTNNDGVISEDEIVNAYNLLKKAGKI